MQIVDLNESNAGSFVHATHDRGVVPRRQVCDDCRFSSVSGAYPLFRMSRIWFVVIIPPMMVLSQLSLEAIKAHCHCAVPGLDS